MSLFYKEQGLAVPSSVKKGARWGARKERNPDLIQGPIHVQRLVDALGGRQSFGQNGIQLV